MKHIHFDVESDGFYIAYWACKDGSDCAVIAMLGDDPEDYMARSAVKWLLRLGVNVLTMSPGKKDYEKMYELVRPVVKVKTVLELAAGTGLIAKNVVNAAAHIEATDASAEMITEAKRDNRSAKLHFSVQDMFCLPYADQSFDVVIVSNALHVVPHPEKALAEIRRVLKDDGVLIAPTFTHAGNSFSGKVKAFFMKLAGFPLHSRWTSKEYLSFLRQNGWTVRKSAVLKASFPLTYAECLKKPWF